MFKRTIAALSAAALFSMAAGTIACADDEISPEISAALATLKVMQREESWKKITETGIKMQKGWLELAKQNNLDITVSGIAAMTTYSFNYNNALSYKTLITQEMLKKGILASTQFYACTQHTTKNLDTYFDLLNDIYKKIRKCESEFLDINSLLDGPICHSGFKRLN